MPTSENRGERRRSYRLNRVLAAEIEHRRGVTPARLFIIDISASGLRATSRVQLPEGEDLVMRIRLGSEPEPLCLKSRVVWQQELSLSEMYHLGLQFVECSPDALIRLVTFIEAERAEGEPTELATEEKVALRNLSSTEIDRLAVLARISRMLNESYQVADVLRRVMDVVVEAMDAERGFIMLDRGASQPEVAVAGGKKLASGQQISYSQSVVESVLETGEPMLSLDAGTDRRLSSSTSLRLLGTRSILCVPLRTRERNLGLIYLDSSISAGVFTKIDLELVRIIADLAAAAIERADYFSFMLQNEKMASMGTLVAGLAHELNTPISAVIGLGELLRSERCDQELVVSLLQEAERCANLVQDLLTMARRERSTQQVDLADVVSSAIGLVIAEFRRHRVDIKVDIAGELPPVLGNADYLGQVVLNLLTNALFEVRDREDGQVLVRVAPAEGRVLLQVRDNGTGIPPEHLRQIFDPFFTTKPSGQGTGLGLSILHQIVTDHGGTVTAENAPEGGALFTVELPTTTK